MTKLDALLDAILDARGRRVGSRRLGRAGGGLDPFQAIAAAGAQTILQLAPLVERLHQPQPGDRQHQDGDRRGEIDEDAMLPLLALLGALDNGLKVRAMTLPDAFQDQDKPERLYAAAGLDAKAIVAKALSVFGAAAKSLIA